MSDNNVPSPLGGRHTLLAEAPAAAADGAAKPLIPVLYQMWLPSKDKFNNAELALLISRAHGHAMLELSLQPGSYYVLLYVMRPTIGMKEPWKDCIPPGTIVIDETSMSRVMEAFGVDAARLFESMREEAERRV